MHSEPNGGAAGAGSVRNIRGRPSTRSQPALALSPAVDKYNKTAAEGSRMYRTAVATGQSIEQLREDRRAAADSQQPLPKKIYGAVIRRANPKQWPKKGLPPNYQDYSAGYEILMEMDTTNPGAVTFPTADHNDGRDPCVVAASAWRAIRPKHCELIDAVPLRSANIRGLVVFMPVDKNYESGDTSHVDTSQWPDAVWLPLYVVLGSLRPFNRPKYILSSDTRAILSNVEEWLASTHILPESVAMLWAPAASFRRKQIAKNPLFEKQKRATASKIPAITVENPLFGAGLVMFKEGTNFLDTRIGFDDDFEAREEQMRAARQSSTMLQLEQAIALQASARFEPVVASENDASTPGWAKLYPMHKAAMIGDVRRVRELIKVQQPPAAPDPDSWTPLHYAAWYGRTSVVRVLMQDWMGSPTTKSDSGATALHFAGRNGHPEVVAILLACPIVDPLAKDNDGKTALDLCETLKQGQWTEVYRMLKNPNAQIAVNRFSKLDENYNPQDARNFRIYLMDGSEKSIRLPGGDDTTALDLRRAIAGMVHIPDECVDMFAVWVASPSLSVQLEDSMKPLKRLMRWPQMLELYVGQSGTVEDPVLVFKRNQQLSLSRERKIRSPAALKFLYDEALVNFTNSFWPTSVEDTVYLAGLLMQIRFGDHDPAKHTVGFLSSGLNTFVPQHLMHNQLKSTEWERRIYRSHQKLVGTTDIYLLHRLFLQYCWQWSFYGATFFDAEILRHTKRLIGGRNEYVRVGINYDWITIIHADANKASIQIDGLQYSIDGFHIRIDVNDDAQIEGLQSFLRGGPSDVVNLESRQAFLFGMQAESLLKEREREEALRQQQRVAQGLRQQNTAPALVASDDQENLAEHQRKLDIEKRNRFSLIHSFGEELQGVRATAHQLFLSRPSCSDGHVPIKELKLVFAEFGYWLGSEIDGARTVMSSTNGTSFNFRDVVSWWGQAQRSWLFLLDDAAFKQRQAACAIFLRNDPQRTGKVSAEYFTGVVKGLRSAQMTKVTEAACIAGLDPQKTGVLHFNDFVDWLCRMHIISDRIPM